MFTNPVLLFPVLFCTIELRAHHTRIYVSAARIVNKLQGKWKQNRSGSNKPRHICYETRGRLIMYMVDWSEGYLKFNTLTSRYDFAECSLVRNKRSFHCGSSMEIFLDGRWNPTRLEHNGTKWYLLGTGLSGNNLEGSRIRIKSINGFLLPY